jgi:hypothetical protein
MCRQGRANGKPLAAWHSARAGLQAAVFFPKTAPPRPFLRANAISISYLALEAYILIHRLTGVRTMADWRTLVINLVLADGVIEDSEVKVLRKELYKDGKIDRKEVEFLIDLRNKAQKKAKDKPVNPTFERFFFKAIEDNVLEDGVISPTEAKWLRTMLFADKKIDPGEKKFLKSLKSKAKSTSKAFDALYDECMAK